MKTFHTDIAVQRSSFENDEGCSENIQEQKYEPSKIVFANLYIRLNPVSIKQTIRFLNEAHKNKNFTTKSLILAQDER